VALLQNALEGVEHLRARAQGLVEGRQTCGDDHELLNLEPVVGMLAAVDDVHQRRGEHARTDAAEIAPEGSPTTSAAARATAMETPRIALAPSFSLFGVPSA